VRAEEVQSPVELGGGDQVQDQAAKQPREHPHGQQEARPAGDPACSVQSNPTTGHDAVHMGVMGQGQAPGGPHRRRGDPGAQVFRVGSDAQQRLDDGRKQQAVDHRLVVLGEPPDGCR